MNRQKKILLIESFLPFINELKDLLEIKGYNIFMAQRGLQALNIASTHNPDLVICNIDSKESDCYWIFQNLNNTNKKKRIPFIFLYIFEDPREYIENELFQESVFIHLPSNIEELNMFVEKSLK